VRSPNNSNKNSWT